MKYFILDVISIACFILCMISCDGSGSKERIRQLEELEQVLNEEIKSVDYEISSTNNHQSSQKEMCPICSGSGVLDMYGTYSYCGTCNGSGFVSSDEAVKLRKGLQQIDAMTGGGGYDNTSINDDWHPRHQQVSRDCYACNGTGICPVCSGIGSITYYGETVLCRYCKTSGECPKCVNGKIPN